MKYIGFSTGALALGDFRSALSMLKGKRTRAVELSALRDHEVEPLMTALPSLNLSGFAYVSVHLPSKLRQLTERQIVALLSPCIERKLPVVLHPDVIENVQSWRSFGSLLCIENMDKRKSTGRTVQELEHFFARFPDATFCLDIAHARQIDSTMGEAWLMLNRFAKRLRQIHISEIDGAGHHHGLSQTAISATASIARLIKTDIPVIIEAQIDPADIAGEIRSVKRAFHTPPVSARASADWGALA